MKQKDISIIGGGIIGTTLTKALSVKFPHLKLCLIEKEKDLGLHTSTRNSSVLHSGVYYQSDSFKAKFCKEGNKMLTQYIIDNKLPLRHTGKFIIANNEEEYSRLEILKKQADLNQIEYQWLDYDEASKIEKYLKNNKKGYKYLFTPTTKVSDNKAVIEQLGKDIKTQNNIEVIFDQEFNQLISQKNGTNIIRLKNKNKEEFQQIESKYVINCAGLYADKIAKQFGYCQKYTVLPFKGTYLVQKQKNEDIKSLIYPIPPKKGNYFLGVHLTCTINNEIKFGPSAFPALFREQYGEEGQEYGKKQYDEFMEIVEIYLRNIFSNKAGFYLKHSVEEIKKIYKAYIIHESKKLFTLFDSKQNNLIGFPKGVSEDFKDGRPGIRAQLINEETRELENDFIIEKDNLSMHLLNVVSPGWTCSMPIAEYVSNIIKEQNIF